MDKISVTESSLKGAITALRNFGSDIDQLTGSCARQLTEQLPELETNFRQDLQRYIETITKIKISIIDFVDENISALDERLKRLYEYGNQTYKQRNYH